MNGEQEKAQRKAAGRQGTDAIEAIAPIDATLNRCRERLDEVRDRITHLDQKLKPVLSPPKAPPGNPDTKEDKAAGAPMRNFLEHLEADLIRARQHLERLIEDLEV